MADHDDEEKEEMEDDAQANVSRSKPPSVLDDILGQADDDADYEEDAAGGDAPNEPVATPTPVATPHGLPPRLRLPPPLRKTGQLWGIRESEASVKKGTYHNQNKRPRPRPRPVTKTPKKRTWGFQNGFSANSLTPIRPHGIWSAGMGPRSL